MKRVVSAQEMRAYEQARFSDGRANSTDWMERAAVGVDMLLNARYLNKSVLCVCGIGNNGGDGWVAAVELARAGYPVTLVAPDLAERLAWATAGSFALYVQLFPTGWHGGTSHQGWLEHHWFSQRRGRRAG